MRYLGSKNETDDVASQGDIVGGGGGGTLAPPGRITMTAGDTPDPNNLLCQGAFVSQATYSALFAKIGHKFNGGVDPGDGTFRLPDFRGVFPMGATTPLPVGSVGGSASVTLAEANLPPHVHNMDHNHPDATTSVNGNHGHEPAHMRSAGGQGTQSRAMAGQGTSALIAPLATSNDGAHNHTSATPIRYQDTGSTGSGTPLDVTPPFQAVNFQITY